MAIPPKASGLRVAIVGATSLKGKELKEVLEQRLFPVKKLFLLDDDEALGQLTEFDGEPTFIRSLSQEAFRETDLVFFASTAPPFTREHWRQAANGPTALIDLSHALLDVPEAVVRVPSLEGKLPPVAVSDRPWYIAPHAAAIVLLTVLTRLSAAFPLRQVIAHVFEPVSERGAAGIDELQEQTVRVLSFQEFPRTVFGAQLAFNLLPRYGDETQTRLGEIEDIIRREVGRSAPALAARLALRVIQVPVFHAHCLSLLVELEERCEVAALEQALTDGGIALVSGQATPAAVDVAGREEILVGPILPDPNRPAAFWLWTASDNLRLTARTAVEIAETLVA